MEILKLKLLRGYVMELENLWKCIKKKIENILIADIIALFMLYGNLKYLKNIWKMCIVFGWSSLEF